MHRNSFVLFLFIGLTAASPATRADGDGCVGFKWDVSKEHVLFGGTARVLSAGADPKSAPVLLPQHLYELRLLPQSTVAFAASPGKATPEESYAGVAALKIDVAGDYRVSANLPLWIDVAADGNLATVEDFLGLHGCDAPRKIVLFDLRGAKKFLLQLSGADQAAIRLTVTKAPPKT